MTVAPAAGALERYCGARTRGGSECRRPAGWGTDHAGQGRCKLHGGRSLIKHGLYSVIKRPRIAELIQHFEEQPDPLSTFPELAAARALFTDWVERYDEITEALLIWHASYSEGMRPVSQEMAQALADVIDELEAHIGPVPDRPPTREERDPQPHGGALARTRYEEEADEEEGRINAAVRTARRLLVALQVDPGLKPRQMPDLADGHRILDTVTKIVDRIQKADAANAISRKNFLRVMMEMGRAVDLHNDEPDPTVRLERIRNAWAGIRLG